MQYVKISFAIMALIGGAEADQRSLSDRAREEDNLASGTSSLDKDIGSLQNQKELHPENFENTMTMENISISQMSDAIKKQARQEKMRNSINTKENGNKALYKDIEKKLKESTLVGQGI
jgi:hypothetical protein